MELSSTCNVEGGENDRGTFPLFLIISDAHEDGIATTTVTSYYLLSTVNFSSIIIKLKTNNSY
jgi:hypothetical protein